LPRNFIWWAEQLMRDTEQKPEQGPLKSEEIVYDAVVLGIGFAGGFALDELIKTDLKILGIDENAEVLGVKSSSRNQCFKLHSGIHYIGDLDTAKRCLKSSVSFAHLHPDLIMDADDGNAPTRNGRHYLMSNSQTTKSVVEKNCRELVEYYRFLLPKFPQAKKIFGEPEKFISNLKKQDYSYVPNQIPFENADGSIENISVIDAIESPESQVDMTKCQAYFEKRFKNQKDLTLLLKHRVISVGFAPNSLDYLIQTQDLSTKKLITARTKAVVNCTWAHIEKLDMQLGYYNPDDGCIVRPKVSLLIEMPKKYSDINTCIFYNGAHCSLTNVTPRASKIATETNNEIKEESSQYILTYEKVTNKAPPFKAGGNIPSYHPLWLLLTEKLTPDKGIGKEYATGILAGGSKYLKPISEAVVKEVRLGFVKEPVPSTGFFSLYDPKSVHHTRNTSGLSQRGLCWFSFAGMKMTYTSTVAKEAAASITMSLNIREKLEELVSEVTEKLKTTLGTVKLKYRPQLSILLNHSLRTYLWDCVSLKTNTPNLDPITPELITTVIKNIAAQIQLRDKWLHGIDSAQSTRISPQKKDFTFLVTCSLQQRVQSFEKLPFLLVPYFLQIPVATKTSPPIKIINEKFIPKEQQITTCWTTISELTRALVGLLGQTNASYDTKMTIATEFIKKIESMLQQKITVKLDQNISLLAQNTTTTNLRHRISTTFKLHQITILEKKDSQSPLLTLKT
jgi:hypothetical protein